VVTSDIHSLSGTYAVDALDDLERARFEHHLAGCEACREEVATMREAAGLLGTTAAVPPPVALRDRVLAEIATVRPLPPPRSATRPGVRRRRWLPALAAAAAVVAALGAGAVVWHPWDDGTEQTTTVADRVLAAADASRQTVRIDGAKVTLVRSTSVGRAVLVTENMPSPPEGHVYELWLQSPAGVMVPAGLMPVARNQTFLLDGDAATATAAGITVEPKGGSREPSTQPIALFDFTAAT